MHLNKTRLHADNVKPTTCNTGINAEETPGDNRVNLRTAYAKKNRISINLYDGNSSFKQIYTDLPV